MWPVIARPGCADEQHPGRHLALDAEAVGNLARPQGVVTWAEGPVVIADEHGDAALQHVEGLVLGVVDVPGDWAAAGIRCSTTATEPPLCPVPTRIQICWSRNHRPAALARRLTSGAEAIGGVDIGPPLNRVASWWLWDGGPVTGRGRRAVTLRVVVAGVADQGRCSLPDPGGRRTATRHRGGSTAGGHGRDPGDGAVATLQRVSGRPAVTLPIRGGSRRRGPASSPLACSGHYRQR